MKHTYLLAALVALALTACGQKSSDAPTAQAPAAQPSATQAPVAAPQASLPAGHPPVDMAKVTQPAPAIALTQKAQVLSSIEALQYTYIEVKQDNQTRWLAATTVAVKKGDTIQFNDGVTMTNFTSKTLKRVFPSITFVDRVVVAN